MANATKTVTDQELIHQCIKGYRQAQYTLYHRYCDAMYTIAFRITGDVTTASEVLQDAFLHVFTHLKELRHSQALGSWIKTIVVRTAWRALKGREVAFQEIEEFHLQSQSEEPEIPLEFEYIEKAIQSLPEGARTVLVLSAIEGFSHKEIAELIGISEGTSKSQLNYARKKLREMLV